MSSAYSSDSRSTTESSSGGTSGVARSLSARGPVAVVQPQEPVGGRQLAVHIGDAVLELKDEDALGREELAQPAQLDGVEAAIGDVGHGCADIGHAGLGDPRHAVAEALDRVPHEEEKPGLGAAAASSGGTQGCAA